MQIEVEPYCCLSGEEKNKSAENRVPTLRNSFIDYLFNARKNINNILVTCSESNKGIGKQRNKMFNDIIFLYWLE